ncbi:MAG TPA: sigma-70 family RNA polymerase sigma factor [Vicinamibacterales bacterium]|nr:sigma-70 family RNA polymerase sigma factor [Vicinamibacterales bacterium]
MTPEQERQSAAFMRMAQAGDQDAYASLLLLLTSATRRFARARLGGVPWIDDVVQETLLTVHRALHTYDPARPFGPWFYAIASTRMIDVIRRERRITRRESPRDPGFDVAEPSSRDDEIDVEAVRAAVRALPGRQREIVTALKLKDESVREVSERLGMSPSAVKVAAHRGYKALRRFLGGTES